MWVYEYLETIEDRSICHFRRFLIKRKIIFCGRIFGGRYFRDLLASVKFYRYFQGGGYFWNFIICPSRSLGQATEASLSFN